MYHVLPQVKVNCGVGLVISASSSGATFLCLPTLLLRRRAWLSCPWRLRGMRYAGCIVAELNRELPAVQLLLDVFDVAWRYDAGCFKFAVHLDGC